MRHLGKMTFDRHSELERLPHTWRYDLFYPSPPWAGSASLLEGASFSVRGKAMRPWRMLGEAYTAADAFFGVGITAALTRFKEPSS